MALNLLQICTRAMDDISSFNVPLTIFDNDDDTAKTLLAAAYKVGEELVRDYEWQEMGRTATVTTTAAVRLYDLEDDYDRLASDTMWDGSTKRYMSGQTTKRDWAAVTNAASSTFRYRWRLFGGQIQLDPVAADVFSFNYEYLSKVYCTSSIGTERVDGWIADTDVPTIPADIFIYGIRYYFSDSKTLPGTSKCAAEYDAVISSRTGKNTPSQAVNVFSNIRRPGRGYGLRRLNIPDTIPTS